MITKEILFQINEQSKILKSDIIVLFNGMIYGANRSDNGPSIIKSIPFDVPYDFNYEIMQFYSKDLAQLIREFNENDLLINQYNIICGKVIMPINNIFQYVSVIDTHNKLYSNMREDNLITAILDFKPYMENALKCKSIEKKLVSIDRNLNIIYHGSMLPINKSDKVSASIYKYTDMINIYNLQIIKKNKIIAVYMACLKIN